MRSRSSSVYSKRPPVQQSAPISSLTQDLTAPSSPKQIEAYSPQEKIEMFMDFGPMSLTEDKDKFWGDFKSKDHAKTSTSPKHILDDSDSFIAENSTMYGSQDRRVMHNFLDLDADDKSMTKSLRAMVIGDKNVGKRSLLKAVVPELFEDHEQSPKQQFDLISKTISKPSHSERYNFWLKELDNNQKLSQVLFDTYYKTCSVFFLVYDVTSKSSFFRLDEELYLLQEACKDKEPTIILIGNKRGSSLKKEVDFQEVALLKEKYNIGLFMEVDILNETPSELRLIMEYCMKDSH